MSINRVKIILVASLSLLGLVTIAAVLWYLNQNRSGHTGFQPYLLLVAFIPLAVVGATDLVLSTRYKLSRWSGVLAIVVGVSGITLLVYLDMSNTLLPYEEWIRRGMP